mmetsp:Transcript_5288/g.7391  ORF Transcript_5288/g.7391 Transcript_5288/m.7391 type:complete len:101 (-) Transcript_5288:125-427(-)
MSIVMPITCTYVFRIDSETEDGEASPDETRTRIQLYLGFEHEVISASRIRLNTTHTDNTTVVHHVVKIKTCAPTVVASRLMGNAWDREDHILFTARPTSP